MLNIKRNIFWGPISFCLSLLIPGLVIFFKVFDLNPNIPKFFVWCLWLMVPASAILTGKISFDRDFSTVSKVFGFLGLLIGCALLFVFMGGLLVAGV